MRITTRMMTEDAVRHMSNSIDQLHKLQDNVATGKKFNTVSEDVVSASLSLSLKSSLRTVDDLMATAGQAHDWMSANEMGLQQTEDLATRALALITRGLSDSLGSAERSGALAPEMDGLLDEAFSLANSTHNGQYIFAGYKVNTPAFDMVDRNTIIYKGDAGLIQRSLGPGKIVNINVEGDKVYTAVFQGLMDARDALSNDDTNALRISMGAIQSALADISKYRTLNGTRLRQVEVAQDYLDRTQIETKSLLSRSEDINLAEGIAMLKSQEINYQVVLEVSQRAISAMSLFDYLQ